MSKPSLMESSTRLYCVNIKDEIRSDASKQNSKTIYCHNMLTGAITESLTSGKAMTVSGGGSVNTISAVYNI